MTASRAARFAALWAVLDVAHDLADHVVQTDHQAAGKAADWRCMAGHVSSYTAVQLLALAAARRLGVRPSLARTATAVTLSASTHALLDRRWPVVELLRRTGSDRFAAPEVRVTGDLLDPRGLGGPLPLHGPYLAGQALHRGVLAVCAAILSGGRR